MKQDISAHDLISCLHKTLDHEVEVLQHQFMRNSVKNIHAAARFVELNRASLTTETGETSEVEIGRAHV